MQTICFYARSGQAELFGRVGILLQTLGYKVVYITQNISEQRMLNAMGCENIYNLTEYLRVNWDRKELLESRSLADIEEQYGIDSIWKIFYTDRFLIKYSHGDSVKFIKLHVAFIEDVFQKEKFNIFFNESVALFSSYIFHFAGRKLGFKYMGFCASRTHATERLYTTNDPYSLNPDLDRYYENGIFNENDLLSARAFIENFRASGEKPKYMEITGKMPSFKPVFIPKLFLFLVSYLKKQDKYDYENFRNNAHHVYEMTNYLRYNLQKKYYSFPAEGESFYLFPLHYQPEASTLVCANLYEKQLYAIDTLAKHIPGDSLLYVKEHYAVLGHREMAFYKALANYPNVRLINPWVDSHDLIKRSRGVIVLTSTAGWEALLYRKPLYILGNVYYQSFKYSNVVSNIRELPNLIKTIEADSVDEYEYEQELQRYIAAYLKSLRNGCYMLNDQRLVLSRSNIDALSEIIHREIERWQ